MLNLIRANKIRFVSSLTGVGAIPGKEMVNGLNVFLRDNANKFGGREVKLIVEDDESSPVKAKQKVLKLIQTDKVDVISGFLSIDSLCSAPVADNLKVPCVIAEAGADDLTQRKAKHWVLRTSFSGSQPTHPFGEYAAKKLGYKRIITIASDYPYGHEAVGGFQESLKPMVAKSFRSYGFLWIRKSSPSTSRA